MVRKLLQTQTILIAAVMILAAVLKYHRLVAQPSFGHSVLDSQAFVYSLILVEVFVSCFLLSGMRPGLAWVVIAFLFSSFAVISLQKAIVGDEHCGCFGVIDISPFFVFAGDVAVLLSALARIAIFPNAHCLEPGRRGGGRAALAFLAFAIPAVGLSIRYSEFSGSGSVGLKVGADTVALLPWDWPEQRFPLGAWMKCDSDLSRGKWRVVIFNADCGRCMSLVGRYGSFVSAHPEYRLAFIQVPPLRGKTVDDLITSDSAYQSCTLSSDIEWHASLPIEVNLEDSLVKWVSSPEIGGL